MVLEERRFISEEEARERADVIFWMRKTCRFPQSKLENPFGACLILSCGIFCLILGGIVWKVYEVIRNGGGVVRGFIIVFFYIALACFTCAEAFYPYYIRNKKYRELMKANSGGCGRDLVILNEVGVFHQADGKPTTDLRWEKVSFVRVYSKCILFCPQSGRGEAILVSGYHEQSVREFLSDNHIRIPIY